MTHRAMLHEVVHALRVYLEAQREVGCVGLSPAPEPERAAFAQRREALQAERLDAIRANLTGGTPTPTRQTQPQAAPGPRADEQRAPVALSQALERAPQAAPAVEVAAPGEALWRTIGSRPQRKLAQTPAAPAPQPPPAQPTPSPESRAPHSVAAQPDAPAARPAQLARPQAPTPARPQAPPPRQQAPDAPRRANAAPIPTGRVEEAADATPFLAEGWMQAQPLPGYDDARPGGRELSKLSARERLGFLRECLGECERCKLSQTRRNIVFGEGSPQASLVFVGEGPGYHEDMQGLPFVGASGELLDRMIEAMGLRRELVYICNVVKCRPPENRNPQPDEIHRCAPFLFKQLETIDPRAIVTLGRFASQTLLESQEPMGRLRGRWRDWRGVPVLPTFHPAYLLRNPTDKRLAWEDLQKVMKLLGLQGAR